MSVIFVLTLMWYGTPGAAISQQEFSSQVKCEAALKEARRVHDKDLRERGFFSGFCAEK